MTLLTIGLWTVPAIESHIKEGAHAFMVQAIQHFRHRLVVKLTSERDIRSIIANSFAQIITTFITSGLGFVFWWWAARAYPAVEVGFAASSIATMNILTIIGLNGIGTYLMGELHRYDKSAGRFIANGLLFVGLISFLETVLCSALSCLFAPSWGFMGETLFQVLLFAVGVSMNVMTSVFDLAMLGLQRGGIQLTRNSVFTVSKLLLLIIASQSRYVSFNWTIYTIWTLTNLISLVVIIPSLTNQFSWRNCIPHLGTLRKMVRPSLGHYLLSLLVGAPSQLLPVLVAATVSKTTNAYFYTSWLVVSFFFIIPYSVVTSLYSVGADHPDELTRKVRFTLRTSLLLGILCVSIVIPVAPLLMRFFGPAYATNATSCLIVLCLAIFGFTIRDHVIVIGRMRHQVKFTVSIMLFSSISELCGALLGVTAGGLIGLCIGWVVALTLEALATSPILIRTMRVHPNRDAVIARRRSAPAVPMYIMPMHDSMQLPQITNAMLKRYLNDPQRSDWRRQRDYAGRI